MRLKDIAVEAGVTTGALQHYWENRESLLEEAFEQVSVDFLLDRWAAVTKDVPDPWDRIVALVEAGLSPRRAPPLLPVDRVCLSSRASRLLRSSFAAIYDAWRRLLTSAIDDGVANGQFAPALPVGELVTVLLTHMDGCGLALAADIDAMDAARFRDLTLTLAAGSSTGPHDTGVLCVLRDERVVLTYIIVIMCCG